MTQTGNSQNKEMQKSITVIKDTQTQTIQHSFFMVKDSFRLTVM